MAEFAAWSRSGQWSTANCKKQIYEQLGLPTVRTLINQGLILTNQPANTAPGYETW